jgi:hypothetical protein
MYIGFVTLTMLVLPLASIMVDHALHPAVPLLVLSGRWFVFWGVGVRLGVAGLRQWFQPGFTAREIFHIEGEDVLPLVRELGIANLAGAMVALLSLIIAGFTLPAAVYGVIFFGIAGVRHMQERHRSRHQTIAMVSDLFMFAVLAVFAAAFAQP